MSHRLFRWILVLVTGVIVVGGGGCGNAPATNSGPANTPTAARGANNAGTTAVQPTTPLTPSTTPAPTGKTVFLIMMENHNWSDIKGSSSAPYINNTLLPMASHAEQDYNPQAFIQANRIISGWRQERILASLMTLTRLPITRARSSTWSPCSPMPILRGSRIKKTSAAPRVPSRARALMPPSTIRWSFSMMSPIPMIRIRPTALRTSGPIANWAQTYRRILWHATTSLRRTCVMTCMIPARLSMML